jgi:uncharacterized protein YdhG (YjbR/CyaY superfamily)
MEENNAGVISSLERLIDVSQKGYENLRQEIKDLRAEFKEGRKEHADRLGRLEQFMFTTQGGFLVTRVLAGASFLGALLAIGVGLYTGR